MKCIIIFGLFCLTFIVCSEKDKSEIFEIPVFDLTVNVLDLEYTLLVRESTASYFFKNAIFWGQIETYMNEKVQYSKFLY